MKFLLDQIFLVAIVVISGAALLWPLLAGRGKKATPLEATQLINRGKTTILDVREGAEFANGHIRDAKHIPLKELAGRVGELEKSKGKSIVIVCQSGARAALAARILQKAGFDDVVSLDGGLAAWQTQGLPVTK